MADTATTRPTRTRAARTGATKAPAAKAAPAKAPVAEAPTTTAVDRFKVEMEYDGDTKSFAKFKAPENMKGVVVGTIYAPLGSKRVLVAVVGPDDSAE